MVSALEGFHCICLRVIITLRRVHLEPKLKKHFTTLFFRSAYGYENMQSGTLGKPLVTYQEEEEGSGVVPILELYKCLAAMPVCKTSLVRCSLSSLASPVKIGDDVEQSD